MATVLEHSKITPPVADAPELSVPLLFFDMLWYDQSMCQCLLFFETDCSTIQFIDDVVPALKHSLSLTLTQFLPLAGNVVHPLNPGVKPSVQFVPGQDYLSLTICEAKSADDFNYLTGNHPRDCADFYEFVPLLSSPIRCHDSIQVPVLALKVTLFPGRGIAFGIEACHTFVDASTIVSFFRAWALINSKRPGKIEDVKALLHEASLLPSYDRSAFTNINGLDSTYWDLISSRGDSIPIVPFKPPGPKVRSTFVLKKEDLQNLKNFASKKLAKDVNQLSSFSVVCALVWSCMAKSAAAGDEEIADDEPDYFSYGADCRSRVVMDPPLPRNYLGNCVANFTISLNHGELKGHDGFARAAGFISEAIGNTVYSKKGILHGAETWLPELWEEAGKRLFWVAGAPRFDFYEADFGWGKASKVEALFTDSALSISLWKSRWVDGGLEISLSRPRPEMEAFTEAFKGFLNDIRNLSDSD